MKSRWSSPSLIDLQVVGSISIEVNKKYDHLFPRKLTTDAHETLHDKGIQKQIWNCWNRCFKAYLYHILNTSSRSHFKQQRNCWELAYPAQTPHFPFNLVFLLEDRGLTLQYCGSSKNIGNLLLTRSRKAQNTDLPFEDLILLKYTYREDMVPIYFTRATSKLD